MKKRITKMFSVMLAFMMVLTLMPATVFAAGSDKGTPNGAPATPAVSHNAWNGDPDYQITFNIWWGNNATSYELYENDKLIDSGDLTANSPNAQSYTWDMKGKANGTYTYKVTLSNSYGSSTGSTNVVVRNGSDAPVDPEQPTDPVDPTEPTDPVDPTEPTDPEEPVNTAPVLTGVSDKTITAGDSFDAKAGVTATDAEDGDLTAKIQVSGQVDTAKAGTYVLTYTVTDKGGLKATAQATITVKEKETSGGVAASDWKAGKSYKIGDVVSYNGKYYECRFAHTALDGWQPANVPALWIEYTGDVSPEEPEPPVEPEQPTDPTDPVDPEQPTDPVDPTEPEEPVLPTNTDRMLIGYWHTWGGNASGGVPFVKLRDVDANWDVINISFAEPVSAGSTNGRMKFEISGLSDDYTMADFKADVKALQAKGKKVVLAIGGYEGYFSLTSDTAVKQFVSDIKGFVDEYGFDGIDIDLEQSSVQFDTGNDPDINNPKSPKIVYMIEAIRQIVHSYDDDFILSWAPETFYMQLGYAYYGGTSAYADPRSGVYLPMINALREETTFVHVQLYNSAPITCTDGKSYSMGNTDAIVAMCKMLLEGFDTSGLYATTQTAGFFKPLRPDQVVIGVPCSPGAAGSGQLANSALQQAFSKLNAEYPGMRGIMTWSINWDVYQNHNSFAKENGAFLHSVK